MQRYINIFKLLNIFYDEHLDKIEFRLLTYKIYSFYIFNRTLMLLLNYVLALTRFTLIACVKCYFLVGFTFEYNDKDSKHLCKHKISRHPYHTRKLDKPKNRLDECCLIFSHI